MAGRAGGQTTTTDSRSKRIRVSRRGGQVLTRARGPSNEERPARPAFAPGCPCPGRSHRTHQPGRQGTEAVRGHRAHLGPFIPATNTIEALNRQIRKIIKTKGSFPDEDSARKLLYLAITRAQAKWRHTHSWSSALAAFRIHFGDRIPDTAI